MTVRATAPPEAGRPLLYSLLRGVVQNDLLQMSPTNDPYDIGTQKWAYYEIKLQAGQEQIQLHTQKIEGML